MLAAASVFSPVYWLHHSENHVFLTSGHEFSYSRIKASKVEYFNILMTKLLVGGCGCICMQGRSRNTQALSSDYVIADF